MEQKELIREKWAEKAVATPTTTPSEDDAKLASARKEILRIINWEVNDDRHRKIDQIKDTVAYLCKILSNVLNNPQEEKFRRIRITNETFRRHVRDAPGAESFMIAAGWHAAIRDHERYFVYEAQPGDYTWRVLEVAHQEVEKLDALLAAKLGRGQSVEGKKAEEEERRQAVRHALEEDRQERHLRFAYAS